MASAVNSSIVNSFMAHLVSSRALLPNNRMFKEVKDKTALRRKSTKDSNQISKNLSEHCEYRGSCCCIWRLPSNRRRNDRLRLQRNPSTEAGWVSTQQL